MKYRMLAIDLDGTLFDSNGVPTEPNIRAIEQAEHAVRVYLKCVAEELHRRLSAEPSLGEPGAGAGVEDVAAMIAQREPVCEAMADKVLDITHLDTDKAVRFVINRCL